MDETGSAAHRRGPRQRLGILLGGVLVVVGVVFHALAASVHPAVDPQLGSADVWAFLQWGWLRAAAWAGIAGGTWLAAWCLTTRDGPSTGDSGQTG